ncbi:unnamed protein product [Orchesella dallaii]|uniref:Uncharacterized protein n=1 Tax=Orchesella dallaii TaxID=48710 RepID=A0ABP1S622_9HEXA
MSGDCTSDNQVGNDNNTHLLNCTHPGRTVIASKSRESKEGPCRQDHIQMKEGVYDDGQANKEPPLVVPSTSTSVNDFESVNASAIEQEQCREHASTKSLALQQTPFDDSRSVMVLPTVLLANQQPNDQLNSFVYSILTGF